MSYSDEAIIASAILEEGALDAAILCGAPEASNEGLEKGIRHFIDKIAQAFAETDFDECDLGEYAKHFYYGVVEIIDFEGSSSSFEVSEEDAQNIIDTGMLDDIDDNEKFWTACYIAYDARYEDLDLSDVHAVKVEARGYTDGHSNAGEYNDREPGFGDATMGVDPTPAERIFKKITSGY